MHASVIKIRSNIGSAQKRSQRIRGYLNTLSGFIWMLFVGSHFMIGNIAPYIQSYFQDSNLAES